MLRNRKKIFSDIAERIHKGGKADLIAGIAYQMSVASKIANSGSNSKWDGTLDANDQIRLTELTLKDQKSGQTVYNIRIICKTISYWPRRYFNNPRSI